MKWFYDLKSSIRILITVLSYLPFIILANIVGGSLEGHSNFLYAVAFIFLAFPIVITVFAVKANKKEKMEKQAKILKEMEEAAERKKEEEKEKSLAKKLSLVADKKCPACGGTIGYNEKTDTYACDFCGTPISISSITNTTIYYRSFKGNEIYDYLNNYVVLDLETTGLDSKRDSIIEIGAIRYNNSVEVNRFHSFVSINFPLSQFIIEHTGITDSMLKGAPTIENILPQLIDFIGDSIIVAHNANFDINFVYDNAIKMNIKLTNNFVDTLTLARRCNLPVKNNKLTTLAKYFKIPQEVAHRSIDDCETTHTLYEKLKEISTKV